jgi:hypothetical protein
MTFIVGAYIAFPNFVEWDPESESRFYDGLDKLDGLRGLELPWVKSVHPHDDAWLERNLRPEWDLVVTGIIGTAYAVRDDPSFGLASTSESGRSAALRFAEGLAGGVARLNEIQGRQAVLAVQLHSAPRRYQHDGDVAAFTSSLRSLAGLDWHGAEVLIEHADALRETAPQKAFLELDDEIAAVDAIGDTRFGVSLNWGRSVIETRDPARVIDHVRTASDAGLLRAFTYTGTADVDNPVGTAWQDSHLGFADTSSGEFESEGSLLTTAHAREIAAALPDDLVFQGLKIAWKPQERSPETRAAAVAANLETVVAISAV